MQLTTRFDPYTALLPSSYCSSIKSYESTFQESVNEVYREYPLLQKIAYVSMHIFRALAMVGLCSILPFNPLINLSICVIGTLIYRFTAEPPCTMRFSFGALEGQLAMTAAKWGAAQIVQEIALKSIASLALTGISFVPVVAWISGVILLSMKLEPPAKACCSQKMVGCS